ncbi:MAG: type III pantothenate kinase [Bacteroidota bacterium]|nr:type III pantothenate kinase [Bacteroidota bacterium]
MNLCIDQGNSSTKVGIFSQNKLIDSFIYEQFGKNELSTLLTKFPIVHCIVSSVISDNKEVIGELTSKVQNLIELTHTTPVPIKNRYLTPESLGNDRLAAIVGAAYLKPDTDVLVIDAGTAITYDFIDAGQNYLGGNIAPGLNLRLRSLHEFTQKLPRVVPKTESRLLGNSTESAILSGALYGIVFEIDGYINALKIKYPQLSTFLTGGSTFYFDTKLKSAIFAERNLVLIGLNRILLYNVQK